MSLSKVLFIALLVTGSHANAVLDSPSRVLPRDPPTPSAYPLGEPCVPEWQYLNFNPNDAKDKAHLEKLHDVICSGELRAVLSHGELAAKDVLAPYIRYFPSGDEEDTFYSSFVESVLHLISEGEVGDGVIGTIVGTLVVDNFGKSHIWAVIFLGSRSTCTLSFLGSAFTWTPPSVT